MSVIHRCGLCSLGLCTLAISLVLLVACNDFPWRFGRSSSSPNVLVITLDTTRADRLGCYGYEPAETPALDQLAKEGIRFDRAYSQAPFTLPSHATLFTGAYPPEHGVRTNGSIMKTGKISTMARLFADHGYRTGAFVSAFVLDSMFGLNPGFEVYSDQVEEETLLKSFIAEVPADVVSDRALDWLEENKDQPFFCWVHFFDPHQPLNPPSPYKERHNDRYDGEIAFMDSQVARLLEWLESRSLRDKTVVIAVADHGEALGEHGEPTHGFFVYDTTVRVPLILSAPGRLAKGRVVKETVGIVDILPTMLELLQWEVPENVSGKSFFPALWRKKIESRGVYSESDSGFKQFGWAKLRSFRRGPWHYIRAPRPELYNMDKDPDELQNLFTQERDLADQFETELASLEDSMRMAEERRVTLDPKARAALESLGYLHVEDSPEDQGEGQDRKDPKDMIRVYNQFLRGQKLLLDGRLKEGIHELEMALVSVPDSLIVQIRLAQSCVKIGEREKARGYLEMALKMRPSSLDAHNEFGLMLAQDGRFQEAISHYVSALKASPNDAGILMNLGQAKMAAGEIRESIEIYKKVLDLIPDNPDAHYEIGLTYLKGGRLEEAAAAFHSAIRLKPDYWQAYNNLGKTLLRMGQQDQALEAVQKAADLMPVHPWPYLNLADCYAEKNLPGEAVKALEQAVQKGFADTDYLRNDIHLKSLKGNQEYEKLFGIIEENLANAVAKAKSK